MSPETELWLLGLSLVAAVVPWAFSMHAKVAVIAHSVESLPEMFKELKDKLTEHESRLNSHEEKIAALQTPPRPRH
jgi:predicted butyrate kinase (DUF1464 family)